MSFVVHRPLVYWISAICCNCRLKLLTGPDFSVEQTEDCMKHAAEDPVPINLKVCKKIYADRFIVSIK